MDEIYEWLRSAHVVNPPCTPLQVEAICGQREIRLPSQLGAFYVLTNGAQIKGRNGDGFVVLPIEEVKPARVAIYGEGSDSDEYGCSWAMAFIAYGDMDFLAFDNRLGAGDTRIFDCWHESFAYDGDELRVVSASFGELMGNFISNGASAYWLK